MPQRRQSKANAKTIIQKPFRPMIDKNMNVMDAIALHPKAGSILGEYGLHCFHCAFNTMDSIEAGARTHGLTDTDIENLVQDLQELIDTTPSKPAHLTLTQDAAHALRKIGIKEKRKKVMLRVTTDDQGGFCMEFDDRITENDRTFICRGVTGVRLVASDQTLWRIGGSTIDFREGRFKLDLAESCGCGKGECGCKK